MDIKLEIHNDKELRAYVKDLIKGQVLSLGREEFLDIVRAEIERKLKGTDQAYFAHMLRGCMTEAITDILRKDHKVVSWNTEFVNPIVEKVVSEILEKRVNIKQMVDIGVKQKLTKLLEQH